MKCPLLILSRTFYVALGGDGAPFKKDDSLCSWLISILNLGKGLVSNTEIFFILSGKLQGKLCASDKIY
jgi:hypothetical protein